MTGDLLLEVVLRQQVHLIRLLNLHLYLPEMDQVHGDTRRLLRVARHPHGPTCEVQVGRETRRLLCWILLPQCQVE